MERTSSPGPALPPPATLQAPQARLPLRGSVLASISEVTVPVSQAGTLRNDMCSHVWKHFGNSKAGQKARLLNARCFLFKRQNLTEVTYRNQRCCDRGKQPQPRSKHHTGTRRHTPGVLLAPTLTPPHYPSLTTGKPQKHRIFSHHTLQITPSRAPSCPVSPCERGQTGSCDRPPRRGRRSHKWVTAGGQGKWNAGPSSLHLPSCLFYLRFPLPGHKTVNVLPASPLPLFCFTIFLLLGQEPHRNRISTTNEMLLKRFSLHYSVLIYIF